MPLLLCLAYLVGHLAAYLAVLRHKPALQYEKGILFYHVISAVVVTLVTGIWALFGDNADNWAWFVSVVTLHGIYSLSFLELWALADDSYSLAILQEVERSHAAPGPELKRALEAIGTRKQSLRLRSLQSIGLVREDREGTVALSALGAAVLAAARFVLFLVNTRKHG